MSARSFQSQPPGKKRGAVKLEDALGDFLRESGLGSQLKDWRVLDAWRDAVGEALAQRARAVRFRDGELVVEVSSAAHMQELKSFTGEQYRAKANALLGSHKIERVQFQLKR